MVYANPAAYELAGGLPEPRLFDPEGRRLPQDELPSVRAARGESLSNLQLDWETSCGLRTVVVSAATLTMLGGRRVTIVTFEDVSDLESRRRSASVLAEELRLMLDGIADAVTVQSPDHRLIYANEAAARLYGLPRDERLDGFSTERYLSDFEILDDLGRPLD